MEEAQEVGADPRIPTATCRGQGCGASIIWTQTPKGKWTPVDAKPVKVYVLDLAAGRVRNESGLEGVRSMPQGMVSGHVPHWATCPDARSFGRVQR
jgi:hypothetical protein